MTEAALEGNEKDQVKCKRRSRRLSELAPSSPSSRERRRGERQVARSAAPSSASAQRRGRTPAGAHVVVVPSGGRRRPAAAAGGHALKAPARTNGEAADGSPAPLLKHHGETAVVVRLVVEIWVVRLGTTFNWGLQMNGNRDFKGKYWLFNPQLCTFFKLQQKKVIASSVTFITLLHLLQVTNQINKCKHV